MCSSSPFISEALLSNTCRSRFVTSSPSLEPPEKSPPGGGEPEPCRLPGAANSAIYFKSAPRPAKRTGSPAGGLGSAGSAGRAGQESAESPPHHWGSRVNVRMPSFRRERDLPAGSPVTVLFRMISSEGFCPGSRRAPRRNRDQRRRRGAPRRERPPRPGPCPPRSCRPEEPQDHGQDALACPRLPGQDVGQGPKESESVSVRAMFRARSSASVLRPTRQWHPGAAGGSRAAFRRAGPEALRTCGLEQ
jgi:hypothetical protein